jgi:hypothetical protein
MRRLVARPILGLGLALGMFVYAGPLAASAGLNGGRAVSNQTSSAMARDKANLRDLYIAMLAGKATAAAYQKALTSFNSRYGVSPVRVSIPNCPIMGGGALAPAMPTCTGNRAQNSLPLTQANEQFCSFTNPQTYCYCGPATAYSILQELHYPTSHDGEALSQNELAITKYLETNYWWNTPWSGLSGDHPMPETLNYWRTGSYSGYYEADGLGMSIPAPDTSTFENDVRYDVDNGWPLAPNTTEVYLGYHLAGHPTSQAQNPIGHWLPIYGYSNYGATFYYADPAHAVPANWGWSAPAYATDSAANFSGLVQARGLVW